MLLITPLLGGNDILHNFMFLFFISLDIACFGKIIFESCDTRSH